MESRGALRYLRELFSCRRFTEVTSLDLDRELTGSERFMLKFHGFYCFICRRFYRQVHKIHAHSKCIDEWCEQGSDMSLSGDGREKIRRAIETHQHMH